MHCNIRRHGWRSQRMNFGGLTKGNDVKHTLIVPYHPRWNDQEERFVPTFKQCFEAEERNSIKQSLARVLFSSKTLPNSSKGQIMS